MPFYLPGGADSLVILIVALVLDAGLGDVRLLDRLLPSPPRWALAAGLWLDRRLNRIDRSDAARRMRGRLAAAVMVLGALLAAAAVVAASRSFPHIWIIEALLLARCLGLRQGWARLGEVHAALASGGVEAGRTAVAPLTRRHLASLDLHGVVRVAIEAGARLLDQRVVAPLFWYALLGLPGAFGWAAADALDDAVGHPDPRHAQFGAAAAHLDDALNFIPARLTALLVALAALFVPGARAKRALATSRSAAHLHPSRNGGWPVAAHAGALDLALAGPRRQGDTVAREPWIGDGRARALPADLRRARALFAVAGLLAAGLVAVAGMVVAF